MKSNGAGFEYWARHVTGTLSTGQNIVCWFDELSQVHFNNGGFSNLKSLFQLSLHTNEIIAVAHLYNSEPIV